MTTPLLPQKIASLKDKQRFKVSDMVYVRHLSEGHPVTIVGVLEKQKTLILGRLHSMVPHYVVEDQIGVQRTISQLYLSTTPINLK